MFKSKSHKSYASGSFDSPLNLAQISLDHFKRLTETDSTDGKVPFLRGARRVSRSAVPVHPVQHDSVINLWKIQYSVEPGTLTWSPVESKYVEEGDYSSSVESCLQIGVSIPPSNCILGAKRTFQLDLRESGIPISASYVSVDPSRPKSVITDRTVLMDVSVRGRGQLQRTDYRGIEYTVDFECQLVLKGDVSGKVPVLTRKLQDIVEEERSLRHFQNGLAHLTVNEDGVLWPMRGRLTVRQTGIRYNFRVVSTGQVTGE